MKNTLTLLCLMLTFASMKAQQIFPIENLGNHKYQGGKISDDTYFKDVNNLFKNYIGTWEGVYNNNSYTIKISKVTEDKFLNYKADRLIMDFEIKNNNGQVIRSTKTNQVQHTTLSPSGLAFMRDNAGKYEFSYSGPNKDSACGDGGIIIIESKNNGNVIHLNIIPRRDMIYGPYCPNGSIQPPFPKIEESSMILNKVTNPMNQNR